MQNIILLMDPSKTEWNISLKGGNLAINRFTIDEDAAFELSGIYYLKQYFNEMADQHNRNYKELKLERKVKGSVKI